jgi:hypothetical protein
MKVPRFPAIIREEDDTTDEVKTKTSVLAYIVDED